MPACITPSGIVGGARKPGARRTWRRSKEKTTSIRASIFIRRWRSVANLLIFATSYEADSTLRREAVAKDGRKMLLFCDESCSTGQASWCSPSRRQIPSLIAPPTLGILSRTGSARRRSAHRARSSTSRRYTSRSRKRSSAARSSSSTSVHQAFGRPSPPPNQR